MALGARDRGVHEQHVRLLRVEEHLAVQLEPADDRVVVPLHGAGLESDLVPVPERAELVGAAEQVVREPGSGGVRAAPCHDLAERRRVQPGGCLAVLDREQVAGARLGEPPPSARPLMAGALTRVAEQGGGERRLLQGLTELRDDLGRGVDQPVEDAHHARADVVGADAGLGRTVPGEAEEVVALLPRQVEPLRDRGDHLLGRLRSGPPLEPGVVVGGHVAERGDLLAPEARGPAPLPGREADVGRLQRLPSAAQEGAELRSIRHASILRVRRLRSHGSSGPGSRCGGVAGWDRPGPRATTTRRPPCRDDPSRSPSPAWTAPVPS
ncbi:hypothetical protein Cus16_2870 [Curtobacterium sp. ER1/6]|nr:hypothetical protein Cus16_2870 [Curtobacterium sp. ER1/6]